MTDSPDENAVRDLSLRELMEFSRAAQVENDKRLAAITAEERAIHDNAMENMARKMNTPLIPIK